jgi:hypothetical protein
LFHGERPKMERGDFVASFVEQAGFLENTILLKKNFLVCFNNIFSGV